MSSEIDSAEEFHTRKVSIIAFTHAVHDTYTGMLPALLPVLIEKFMMTNTAAGLLAVFLRIPSLLQPLIGRLADKNNLKLFIILTPAITGVGMSLLGIAPSYGFLILFLLIAGFSSAALHAVAPVMGSTYSGNKLGRGMSFWMVGGEMGRALGPIVVVTAIGYLTLEGLPWLMIAGGLISFFLYEKLKDVSTISTKAPNSTHWRDALKEIRWVMLPITILVFTRSMVTATLTTFLPTFLRSEGSSLWTAGASLTILEISGMVGAFLAGTLSDRLGRRTMLFVSYIATPVLMVLFVQTNTIMKIPLLILLGFFAIAIVPVLMAVVIENTSENRSFANGIYMALSFALQALATFLVGFISDLSSLRLTFLISAGFLPLGLIFIYFLPKNTKNDMQQE
jgi:FSR family fosmidomycin resistance protein-like MFS transporter